MAEFSGIGWTDHTQNFWIGCTEASDDGCPTCYARELAKKYQFGLPLEQARANRAAGIAPYWGPGVPRRRTAAANWLKPFKWDAEARARGTPYKVFAQSLADFFDNEIDPQWRLDAWDVIRRTPNLRWQILTKRVPNIRKMLPPDWGDGWPHVGFVASVVTQDEMDRDAERMMAVPARWIGFSLEPQVELIEVPRLLLVPTGRSIWFITGGDSEQKSSGLEPRPYDVNWAREIIATSRRSPNVVPFVKQLGARPLNAPPQSHRQAGDNVNDWPADIRVREFPPEVLA